MNLLLEELFRHNRWANLKLLEVCEPLSDEQLDATVTGTFGSIRDTLGHILRSEARYVWLLTDQEPEDRFAHGEWPGFERLRSSAQRSGDALIHLAARGNAKPLIRQNYEGKDWEIDPKVVLVQAINHATEHRSQVLTTLTHVGVQPPELDGWTFGDAAGLIRESS